SFPCARDRPHAHSFPTRRSSDLDGAPVAGIARESDERPDRASVDLYHLAVLGARVARETPTQPLRRLLGHAAILHQVRNGLPVGDRKSTRLNSSHLGISYAVFCL